MIRPRPTAGRVDGHSLGRGLETSEPGAAAMLCIVSAPGLSWFRPLRGGPRFRDTARPQVSDPTRLSSERKWKPTETEAHLTSASSRTVLTQISSDRNIRRMLESKSSTVAALWLLFSTLSVVGADFPLKSTESVAVLRNGFVLRGSITPLGDHYLITQANADRVRMPAARVEMICKDLNEAYLRKRDLISIGNVPAHLALASWSMRHQLLAQAADQVLAAIALDPGNPRIPPFQKRLLAAIQPSPSVEPVRVDSPATETDSAVNMHVSAASIQQFTTSVQPLLMNRCAAGACHGPGSESELRIIRPPFRQLVTSRLTHRNLRAVLPFVALESPASSPLLTTPQQPHGGLSEPVLDSNTASQNATILRWLVQLRLRQPSVPRSTQLSEQAALGEHLHAADSAELGPDGTKVQQASYESVVPAGAAESKDPFDPEIFNQRHAAKP